MRARTGRTTAIVFRPEPGEFDELTWRSPTSHVAWAFSALLVPVGIGLAVLANDWTRALPFVVLFVGQSVARSVKNGSLGAGPAGVYAGRFAIPWARISTIDESGYAHLDPPAKISKAVRLSGELPKVRVATRGWPHRELGQAVARWAPVLRDTSGE